MNLEDVLGIIIYKDGIPHSFGKAKTKKNTELTADYYHKDAFIKDIVASAWFKETGVYFNIHSNIVYKANYLASLGFITIINASCCDQFGDDFNIYTIETPNILTDNMIEYLKSIYQHIKELIDNNNAIFYSEIYDEEGNNNTSTIYEIDELYDKLNINIKCKVLIKE